MSLINRKSFILDDEEIDKNLKSYKLPSLVLNKPEVISLAKSSVHSVLIHILTIILVLLFVTIQSFLALHFKIFQKPKVQLKKDLEFVLVDNEAMPKNPNTKYRSDKNSRTGGKNDPNRKVSMPSPAPQKTIKSATSAPAQKVVQKTVTKKVVQPKTVPQKVTTTQKTAQTQQKTVAKPSMAKPAPPTSRPSSRPVSAPTPVAKPSSAFSVPPPKSAPVGKSLATGPIGGTSAHTGNRTSGGYSAPTGNNGGASVYAPRPSLSSSGSASGGQLGRSGSGNVGNPGGGGGNPGIDALREPDFGPYMRELQNRIKNNWNPPKGNESKRVVLLFKIAKDGRLLSCRIHRSSGLPTADQAALKAVELTAPFRPLPVDFKGQSIDIQFTFDYNVFGASKY